MDNQREKFTNTEPILLPKEENGQPVSIQAFKKTRVEYCLYARKSTEDDERQALSIDSQIKEMAMQAQEQGVLVTEIRRESHSAKNSGQRPVFNQIIADIRLGKFQGILSWAPDRLSRNAGDLGTLVDLMDQGLLKELRTHGQVFTNSPNDKFLLMILCSQAKLENDNRGINVKRGFRAKCEMGFRPNLTPLGYINDHYSGKGQKKVFVDKARAPIIKQIFEKVAYEGYSGRKVYDWLKEKTNLRSRNDKILNLSVIYRMLNNPYYCGLFEFPVGTNKWYKGNYEPIISRELFDLVQKKMQIHPKSKPGTKKFNFTKLFRCGACGSGITAQERFKRLKDGTVNRYIYYHCTQFNNFDCHEPYTREELIVEQLKEVLKQIPIENISNQETLKPELDKFMFIQRTVENQNASEEKIDLSGFIEYILQDGSREQKQDLIKALNSQIYIRNRTLYLEK